MKISSRPNIFYVSPWLLAAATGLLVLIVVTFTLNNIRREQQLMTQAMLQKADTLMRIVHSGARSAYIFDLGRGAWRTDPWHEYVQRMVSHVAEEPEVLYLAVVDEAGTIVVHNNRDRLGNSLAIDLPESSGDKMALTPVTAYRISDAPGSGRQFEAVRVFFPYRPLAVTVPHDQWGGRRGQRPPGGMLHQAPTPQEGLVAGSEDRHKYYIVVGLDMGGFDQALRRLRLQAVVLSVTMLLVGIGGWLSLAAVQGYRVSQRTLGEIKAFTALLVAKLPVGIIATDRGGRVTTWNRAAAEMTGVSTEAASGKFSAVVLPSAFSGFFSAHGGQNGAVSGGREQEVTVKVAGAKQHLLCHAIDVLDQQGEYQGEVLLISNLTQIKGMEKEMRENERLAAVGRMAAGVAHEVRNPLSSIKGLALLLKGKFVPDSHESETAGLLIQEVERMNRTVSELLSFARPAPLHVREVHLNDLLADTLRLIASDTESSRVATRLHLAEDLLPVAGDPDRLNQVFLNLLLNAVQSMEQGGDLTVTAENSRAGESVLVSIRDSGCGIAQENLSQLFYPYFTTKSGGTGIGLAISQKIISDHKGSIKIDSNPGQGTTVTVELPVYRQKEEAGTA